MAAIANIGVQTVTKRGLNDSIQEAAYGGVLGVLVVKRSRDALNNACVSKRAKNTVALELQFKPRSRDVP